MDRNLILLLGIAGFVYQVGCGEKIKYDEYSLVRLVPQTNDQLEKIKKFKDPEDKVEILKRSYGVNDSLDILVLQTQIPTVKQYANLNHIDLQIKHNSYGRTFGVLDTDRGRRFFRGFDVYAYNSYTAIQEEIDMLSRKYPHLMTAVKLGNSYEGRRMNLVKISKNPDANNPIIFIDAGVHAREWVAPAMAMYIINRLVLDPQAHGRELNGVDWYILPVVNPDGYEFTRASRANRLWRKTRSRSKMYNCFGVDGNRNYGFNWGVSGISSNPCDKETYAGPEPFSEPETRMVKNIMLDNARRIKLYVSLHAYGQYLVYPWGYTGNTLPKGWQRLDSMARKVSSAVQSAGGKPFTVMSAGQWYPAAGGSDDFAFGAAGIPYSYTMELTQGYEFQYPEANLRAALPQFYEGFKTFASEIKKEYGAKRSKHTSRNVGRTVMGED